MTYSVVIFAHDSAYCFFFKQKTAYEMRISDWSSDVCSSDLYAQVGGNVIGALEVAPEETDKYGIISPGERHGRLVEVTALVEKPARGTAPSNLMIPGRYILQPEVMRV